MKGVRIWMVAVTAYAGLSANVLYGQGTLEYPQTATVDHVDEYHGTQVPDPYRWLEDDVRTSEQVAAWVAAENKVTFAYLEAIPQREPLRKRLTELWDYEKYSSPFKTGGRYFYFHNTGLQNQSVLFTMASLTERTARVDRSEHMVAGRHGGPGGTRLERRRQVHRLRHPGRRQRLADLEDHGDRLGQDPGRRAEVDQVLRACPGPRTAADCSTAGTTSPSRTRSSSR